jgi:CheY-like chemotaxis protein
METTTLSPQKKQPEKKFILVAEDDNFYANIYKVKLAKEGYEVVVVGNGEWVLKALQKKIPNLILLDLIMPVKDGFDTLKEIKANPVYAQIPVMILSNLSQEEDKQKAKDLGAVDFITKADVPIHDVLAKIKLYCT